ncbi:Unknown protein, partial [Striga hermonthica]
FFDTVLKGGNNNSCSKSDGYQTIQFHHLTSKGQEKFDLLFLEGMIVIAEVPCQFQRILQML